MENNNFKDQLTSDIKSKLTALLKQEPDLSPEAAMVKITKEMLENNPFVPPEGDKCPINVLPDELLAYIFEMGMNMEFEAKQFGENDEEYESGFSDSEEDESDEDEDETEQEIVEVEEDSKDDEEWSDVDEDEEVLRREKKKRGKAKIGDSGEGDGDDEADGDDEEDTDDENETELPFQVLVSHVCKRWRDIALATPSLWTLLDFQKGTPFDKHIAFVERAKNAPLDIIIDCTYADAYEDEPELHVTEGEKRDRELVDCLKKSIDRSDPSLPDIFGDPNWHTRPGLDSPPPDRELLDDHYYSISELSEILDLLIPRVQHWRALSVSVSDYRWIYLLLARLHQCGPADTLEVMELYHYDDNDSGELFRPRHLAIRFTPFHGRTPRLRNCTFWGVHLDWDASLGIFKNVEDIELAYHTEEVRPSYKTLETILKSSDIKILTLCLSGPQGTEDDWRAAGATPIQVPSLEGLTLRYHSPHYACSLLRFLDTPNIKSLALDFDEQDYTDFAKDLCKAPHGRSKSLLSGLENFKVSGLPCSRALVDKMLEQLANLKSLNLNCIGEGEMFFEALLKTSASSDAGSSARKIYCPALEAITTSGISGKQMREFVEVRAKAGVPVKRVFMSEKDDVDLSSERWLKDHVKEFEYFDPSDSEEEVFEIDDMDDIDDDGDGDDEL